MNKRYYRNRKCRLPRLTSAGLLASMLLVGQWSAAADDSYQTSANWWAPGQGGVFPARAEHPNASGRVGVLNTAGAIDTRGHPFFEAIGSNGRACVTCHQPADGMSISVETIQRRWQETKGTDPLFAAVDGKNCPHLPQGEEASHSLLLNRGLIRVFLPWPPQGADGKPITPEFNIEVVRDPTGCNTHPEHGLHSTKPTVSVYRRPRPVANLKYVATTGGFFNIKTGYPLDKDPDTGLRVGMNIMADARAPTLKLQAIDAAMGHLQTAGPPSAAQLKRIVDFENSIYMAQSFDAQAGDLVGEGAAAGPEGLQRGNRHLGDDYQTPVFPYFAGWKDGAAQAGGEDAGAAAFRDSVLRGNEIYMSRTFWIRDSTHINSIGLGNPIKRTCATCHNMAHTGMDLAPGYVDLGTTNRPWANETKDLPLFKLTCRKDAPPHAYLGRVIFTYDPGRALISGLCADIGSITMQQMRGLAARAPYFSNGSATTLREIIDFYDRRYNIGYSEQEKQDLVNFMSVL